MVEKKQTRATCFSHSDEFLVGKDESGAKCQIVVKLVEYEGVENCIVRYEIYLADLDKKAQEVQGEFPNLEKAISYVAYIFNRFEPFQNKQMLRISDWMPESEMNRKINDWSERLFAWNAKL